MEKQEWWSAELLYWELETRGVISSKEDFYEVASYVLGFNVTRQNVYKLGQTCYNMIANALETKTA